MKLGPSFADSIRQEKITKRRYDDWSEKKFRIYSLPILGVLVFVLLLVFLAKIQIVEGGHFRQLSDGNRTRERTIHAPRGVIYDRFGNPLVHNIPGFRLMQPDGKSRPIRKEQGLLLLEEKRDLLTIDTLRQYVSPFAFSHLLGFIGEISEDELKEYPAYTGGDFIGKTGAEKAFESVLKGQGGKELLEVAATGEMVRTLGKIDPKSGRDVTLSVDKDLMIAAYRAMEEVERGALIVSDPNTGEILALISKPSFDANLFTLGADYDSSKQSASESAQTIETLFEDANQPLFNRVIGGTYPPGSTFKIITAAAGLETGEIDGETEFEDIGVIRIGAFSFPNWYFLQYGKTEGFVDIVKGLKRSNDIFFYKAAELVGLERLGQMARHFGVGEKLGINMEGEASGLFPSDEWKRQAIGEQWFLGDTYHLGIGQGYLLTTPLQVNSWAAVIANGGTLCEPTIIKSEKCKVKSEKFLNEKTMALIREGMKEACADGGTGWPLFKFKMQNAKIKIDEKNFFTPEDANPDDGWAHIPIVCKTGTAEFGDPKDRTHAWFTAYAPIEDPELVVTVLVEAGGEGSNVAAPIAKKVFEEWFSR